MDLCVCSYSIKWHQVKSSNSEIEIERESVKEGWLADQDVLLTVRLQTVEEMRSKQLGNQQWGRIYQWKYEKLTKKLSNWMSFLWSWFHGWHIWVILWYVCKVRWLVPQNIFGYCSYLWLRQVIELLSYEKSENENCHLWNSRWYFHAFDWIKKTSSASVCGVFWLAKKMFHSSLCGCSLLWSSVTLNDLLTVLFFDHNW